MKWGLKSPSDWSNGHAQTEHPSICSSGSRPLSIMPTFHQTHNLWSQVSGNCWPPSLTRLPEWISLQTRKWKWHQWVRMDGWIGISRWRWEMLKRWLVSINQQMCHGSWWQTPICPIAKLCALALLSWSWSQAVYYSISDPHKRG